MLRDDINTAATSCSSLPLLRAPHAPHQLPTMPHLSSQPSTQGASQQGRAQRLLVADCGFRPGPSHGSASSFSSSEPPTPPKLVPIFRKRPPPRQASLEAQSGSLTSAPPIASSSPYPSHLTTMTFPAHNLVRPHPGPPRLWVPPAAKVRCPLKTTLKGGSGGAGAISKHRPSSGSSSQVSPSHL